jgi:hypothetical protein
VSQRTCAPVLHTAAALGEGLIHPERRGRLLGHVGDVLGGVTGAPRDQAVRGAGGGVGGAVKRGADTTLETWVVRRGPARRGV